MNTRKTTKATSASDEQWTEEERAAMKERNRELKAARGKRSAEAVEAEVLAKIAEMPASDRKLGERVHAIVRKTAPDLVPRLWYGMPAYTKDGKNVCFFQAADKFKARYATLGFDEAAHLDEGHMWPTSWALTELTSEVEARIEELVRKAVG
jgi:uncharacterized protein YdhG (YjbR/CyaY superfamily)